MSLQDILAIMRQSGATSCRYKDPDGIEIEATFPVTGPEGTSDVQFTPVGPPARPQFRTGNQ